MKDEKKLKRLYDNCVSSHVRQFIKQNNDKIFSYPDSLIEDIKEQMLPRIKYVTVIELKLFVFLKLF